MRLLLVEDERRLADRLARGLREEGFSVDCAPTCAAASERAAGTEYDLVLLDLGLPDGSGIELLRAWRREGFAAPILILTARDLVDEKVEGLNAGADDYLTKPFAFEEVLARVRALLRRRAAPPRSVLAIGGLTLDRDGRRAEKGGEPLDLTPRELSLLEYFMLHPGVVLSRSRIAEHVWDEAYEARSNTIDVIVARLRRKIEGDRRLIHSVPGRRLRAARGRGAVRRSGSLVARLTWWFAASLLALYGVPALLVYFYASAQARQYAVLTLKTEAEAVASYVAESGALDAPELREMEEAPIPMWLRVTQDGRILAKTPGAPALASLPEPDRADLVVDVLFLPTKPPYVLVRHQIGGGRKGTYVEAIGSMAPLLRSQRRLGAGLLLVGFVIIPLAALGGRALAQRALRPIGESRLGHPAASIRTAWTSAALFRRAASRRSPSSPAPSTRCSAASTRGSSACGASPPTPRTKSAIR